MARSYAKNEAKRNRSGHIRSMQNASQEWHGQHGFICVIRADLCLYSLVENLLHQQNKNMAKRIASLAAKSADTKSSETHGEDHSLMHDVRMHTY